MGNLFTYRSRSVSIEEDNFTRMGMALLTIGPMILQEVLMSYISPKELYSAIKEESFPSPWNTFTEKEEKLLQESTSNGYTNFDIIFCYKLLKFVRLKYLDDFLEISSKTKLSAVTTEIERIMRLQYEIYNHVGKYSISTRKFKDSWEMLVDICTKMQFYYPTGKRFPQELASIKSRKFTEDERKIVIGHLMVMRVPGEQWSSLEIQAEVTQNVDVPYERLRDNFSKVKKEENIIKHGIRMQSILRLIELHLNSLADTLNMLIIDKGTRMMSPDGKSDLDSDSSTFDQNIPFQRLSKPVEEARRRASETAENAYAFSGVIRNMKDDLFLLSADVNGYVMEIENDLIYENDQGLKDYLGLMEDIEGKLDNQTTRKVNETIEYHIQQMEECIRHLSQEVDWIPYECRVDMLQIIRFPYESRVSTEREDGYSKCLNAQRQDLYQRCTSFKDDWILIYSNRIRKYAEMVINNIEDQKIEYPSKYKGKDKVINPRNSSMESEVEVSIASFISQLSEIHRHQLPGDLRLSYLNRFYQFYYRTKVIQSYLIMLGQVMLVFKWDNDTILDISQKIKEAEDELDCIYKSCISIHWVFDLIPVPEYLDIFKRHWRKWMHEHKKQLFDERLERSTEKIKYIIHHLGKNIEMLLNDMTWFEDLFPGDRTPNSTLKVRLLRNFSILFRHLSDFVETIERPDKQSCNTNRTGDSIDENKDYDDKLKVDHSEMIADISEDSDIQGRRQNLQMLVESLKEKHRTTHFLIHKKDEHDERQVIIGYDTSIPKNKILRVELEEMEIEVFMKNPYHVSDEAAFLNNLHLSGKRSKPDDEILEVLHECIKENAPYLWKKHSNLTIITGDTIKAVNNTPVPETCIVLYCLSKGYIPINEEPFPKDLSCRLGKIKTDVREGYFCLGPTHLKGDLDAYNDPICMGSNIGGSMRNASGSLGLFINLPNNEKGFITCCHVLFDCIKPNRFSYEKQSTDATHHVVQPGNSSFCGRTDTICGEIKQAKFYPNVSPVSIDAAIVKVNSRMPTTGHFVIKNVPQAIDLGFTRSALPVFDTGKVRRHIDKTDLEKPLLKSGTSSGLTRSLFRLSGTQVRIFDDGVWLGIQGLEPIVMKGQYEVESGSIHNPFFITGDSGSAVFMKDPDGKLACIGIAIGKTSYDTTVVTPIGAVLDGLGLKDSDVTKFP